MDLKFWKWFFFTASNGEKQWSYLPFNIKQQQQKPHIHKKTKCQLAKVPRKHSFPSYKEVTSNNHHPRLARYCSISSSLDNHFFSEINSEEISLETVILYPWVSELTSWTAKIKFSLHHQIHYQIWCSTKWEQGTNTQPWGGKRIMLVCIFLLCSTLPTADQTLQLD